MREEGGRKGGGVRGVMMMMRMLYLLVKINGEEEIEAAAAAAAERSTFVNQTQEGKVGHRKKNGGGLVRHASGLADQRRRNGEWKFKQHTSGKMMV